MNILHDYVLVRVDEEKTESKGGILLQTKTVKLPSTGVIEAVGPEVTTVKVGDKVEFLRYAAIDGFEDDTRFCKEKHILAVI